MSVAAVNPATAPESSDRTDSGLEELTKDLGEEEGDGESSGKKEGKEPGGNPVPPNAPESGVSILAHKIWIGNLDKRLSQYVHVAEPYIVSMAERSSTIDTKV